MADRKYSVEEIELMREAIGFISSMQPMPSTPDAIEARLRTYMVNGTEPAELRQVAHGMFEARDWHGFDPGPSPFKAAPIAVVPEGFDLGSGAVNRIDQ